MKKGTVLVHCKQGVSRSAAAIMAYLIKRRNKTFEQALEWTRTARACINPNPAFRKQLKQLAKKILSQVPGIPLPPSRLAETDDVEEDSAHAEAEETQATAAAAAAAAEIAASTDSVSAPTEGIPEDRVVERSNPVFAAAAAAAAVVGSPSSVSRKEKKSKEKKEKREKKEKKEKKEHKTDQQQEPAPSGDAQVEAANLQSRLAAEEQSLRTAMEQRLNAEEQQRREEMDRKLRAYQQQRTQDLEQQLLQQRQSNPPPSAAALEEQQPLLKNGKTQAPQNHSLSYNCCSSCTIC